MEKGVGAGNLQFSKSEIKEIEKFYLEKYLLIHDYLEQVPRPIVKDDEGSSSEEEGHQNLLRLPARLCPAVKKEKQPAKTVDELLARLAQLRGIPKLAYKEKLAKKKLKNKLLKKEKKERKKQKILNNKVKQENGVVPIKKQKPLYNSEGQIIYSKFDFSVLGAKKTDFKNKARDPKVALKIIREQEKKIKNLKESGEVDKVREIVENKAIKSALMRSEGIKVRDDTELLKKTILKKKLKKEKSKRKWAARVNKVEKDQEERQKKRTANIQARSHKKKVKKLKKAAKKGRIIPGF